MRRTPGAEGSCPSQATVAGPGSENAGPADSPAHPQGARSLGLSLPFTPSQDLRPCTQKMTCNFQTRDSAGPRPHRGHGATWLAVEARSAARDSAQDSPLTAKNYPDKMPTVPRGETLS